MKSSARGCPRIFWGGSGSHSDFLQNAENPKQPEKMTATREVRTLYLASGNAGKLKEFRVLAEAGGRNWQLELLPDYAKLPEFEESALTFAENAAGKAFYYSRQSDDILFADDS